MKKKPRYRRFMIIAAASMFISDAIFSQTASIQWNLISDSIASTTVGNISGQSEKLSYSATDSSLCMYVKDYAANGGGQRVNLGPKTWPNQSVIDTGRYIQFEVQPLAGNSFQVSSVSMTIGAGGTSAMRAAIYYSTNPMFSGSNVLASTLILPNSGWYDSTQTEYTVSATISESERFYIRVYPWYNSSNASTTKYVYLRNVKISGNTFIGTSTPTVFTSAVTSVTAISAVSGGTVASSGLDSVTARGICWNTGGIPTIADSLNFDGSGTGIFTSNLSGLTEGTTYYLRAYATNSYGTSYGEERSFMASNPPPRLPAFPGAEGFGKYVVGGRGGSVIEVTSLEDTTTPGTLRYAINQAGPRTVVFRVSGTIILKSNLTISNPYITIAGQTAPGDGICLRRYPMVVAANQVIVRYIRCRLGDETGGESDSFDGRGVMNVIIDHCSASWSEDETLSFYWCDSTTIQWCISSESLYNSNHPKGAHGYGGIWGGPRATFHHNLLAHHSSRNPRFASGVGITDYRNNVVFNWGFNSSYGAEDTSDGSPVSYSNVNIVNNYYKPGPATYSGQIQYRIMNPSTHDADVLDASHYGRFYVDGNVVAGNSTVTMDNWNGGIQPQGGSSLCAALKSDSAFPCIEINLQTADSAYASVLADVGANHPKRDSIDARIISEVQSGTATFQGSTYSASHTVISPCGILDSQSDVGGWPVLASTPPPSDSDHDGMPDAWETQKGLNPNDVSDRNSIGPGGYTFLEDYLNSPELIGPTSVAVKSDMPVDFNLSQNYPNPFNPTTKIDFQLKTRSIVTLKVYDVLGRVVANLVEGIKEAGISTIIFDGTRLSSGIYFARFGVESLDGTRFVQMKKMLLLK